MIDYKQMLIRKNLCIFNFEERNLAQLYNPTDYRINQIQFGYQYTAVIDQNVFQQIISIGNGKSIDSRRQYAIAFLIFCQESDITIEPNMSIYEEYLNPSKDRNKVIEELRRFYLIDHVPTGQLHELLQGKRTALDLPPIEIESNGIQGDLDASLPLKRWNAMYLTILKIVDVHETQIGKRTEKICALLKWMTDEFYFSLIGLIFLAVLVGKAQISGHYKFDRKSNADKKKRQLANMAWDLYYCDTYLRKWVEDEPDHYWIYCSEDKVVLEMLRVAVDIHFQGDLSPLKSHLNVDEVQYIVNSGQAIGSIGRGVIVNSRRSRILQMISDLEAKVLSLT